METHRDADRRRVMQSEKRRANKENETKRGNMRGRDCEGENRDGRRKQKKKTSMESQRPREDMMQNVPVQA